MISKITLLILGLILPNFIFSEALQAKSDKSYYDLILNKSNLSSLKKEVSLAIKSRKLGELEKNILKVEKILERMARAYEKELILKNKKAEVEYQSYVDFADRIRKARVIIRICRAHTSVFHKVNADSGMNTLTQVTSILFEEISTLSEMIVRMKISMAESE